MIRGVRGGGGGSSRRRRRNSSSSSEVHPSIIHVPMCDSAGGGGGVKKGVKWQKPNGVCNSPFKCCPIPLSS